MVNEELINKRKIWYTYTPVLYALLEVCQKREVVFGDTKNSHWIRGLSFKSIQGIKYIFEEMGFYEKNYNIYISCAKYVHIPNFTFNLSKRSEETLKWFHDIAIHHIISYDFLLDFDSEKKNYDIMINEVLGLLYLFKKYNIKCFIQNSGYKNIHIVIPKENFNSTENILFVNSLINRFSIKTLCSTGIGVYNKIFKCPYSLVNDIVVLPQSIDKILFEKEICRMDTQEVLNNIMLKNRGFYFSNYSGVDENYYKFIKDLLF